MPWYFGKVGDILAAQDVRKEALHPFNLYAS
jgi:hypothetical protein